MLFVTSSPCHLIPGVYYMDTNIIIGTESGLETILVLTGVTRREDVARYPYRLTQIVDLVADIVVE